MDDVKIAHVDRALGYIGNLLEATRVPHEDGGLAGLPSTPKIPEIIHDLFPVVHKHLIPALKDGGALAGLFDKSVGGWTKRKALQQNPTFKAIAADADDKAVILRAFQEAHGVEAGQERFSQLFGTAP